MRRVLLIASLGVLLPATAWAGNSVKPRVPPTFLGGSCIQTVDRAQTPTWHSDIGIPYEDFELTEDEPEDSRRFQFFGICRSPAPLEPLPTWINRDDVDRAEAVLPWDLEVAEDDVLETSQRWSEPGHDGEDGSCFLPIVADDARIPITCDDTAPGLSWDLSETPLGNYVVWGYTWEPDLNLWTSRPGVVRVIEDGSEPDPAVAFSYPAGEVQTSLGVGVMLEGCVEAAEGSALTLSWALASDVNNPDVDAKWTEYASQDVEDTTFEFAFEPPESVRHKGVFFRAEVEEPSGRSWVSYTRHIVVFLDGCEAPDGGAAVHTDACEVGGDPVVPIVTGRPARPCIAGEEDSGSSSSGAESETETEGDATSGAVETGETSSAQTDDGTAGEGSDTDEPGGAGDDTGGCGCDAREPARGGSPFLFGWLIFALVRKRPQRPCAED